MNHVIMSQKPQFTNFQVTPVVTIICARCTDSLLYYHKRKYLIQVWHTWVLSLQSTIISDNTSQPCVWSHGSRPNWKDTSFLVYNKVDVRNSKESRSTLDWETLDLTWHKTLWFDQVRWLVVGRRTPVLLCHCILVDVHQQSAGHTEQHRMVLSTPVGWWIIWTSANVGDTGTNCKVTPTL